MKNSYNVGKSVFLLANILLVIINLFITILGFTNIESEIAVLIIETMTMLLIFLITIFLIGFITISCDSTKNVFIGIIISMILVSILVLNKEKIDVIILNFLIKLKELPVKELP